MSSVAGFARWACAASRAPDPSGGGFSFEGEANSTGWVPFSDSDGRVTVRGTLNGRPVRMVLDTGVGSTVVSSNLAAAIGLVPQASSLGVGVTGAFRELTAGPIRLTISNLHLTAPAPTILDLSGMGAGDGTAPDVILGRDLFGLFDVELSFDQMLFRISATRQEEFVLGFTAEPLSPGIHLRPHAPILLQGDVHLEAMVDLGSDAPLYVSPDFVRSYHLLEGHPNSLAASMGAEGPSIDTIFTLPTVVLGGVTLRQVPARSPPTWSSSVPAVIGLPVLSRFDLVFSFARRRLWVRPQRGRLSAPFQKDHSGLGAVREGDALRIVFVSPSSPGELAGLRVGDEIIEINNRPLDPAFFAGKARLGAQAPGTRILLRLKSRREVTLILAEYY